MRQYKAIAITNLRGGGNLELDEDQLRRRRHLVTENEDGTYAFTKPVQFKRGETFGYDGEIPRHLAVCAEDYDDGPEDVEPLADEPEDVEEEVETFPQHRGGGYWLLSNGDKIRGKADALDAEAALA